MVRQHTMALGLPDYAGFDNFHPSRNREVLALLREFLSDSDTGATTYIWGESGVGKTHLLFAACKLFDSSLYLSVADQRVGADVLDMLDSHELICFDNFEAAAGRKEWEQGMMTLLERRDLPATKILVAAKAPPDALELNLPDLQSRLSGQQVLRLRPVSDEDRISILVDRAARRGMNIEQHVARYAINRYCRNMHSVLRLLHQVERSSLEQHRKITIPLINQLELN